MGGIFAEKSAGGLILGGSYFLGRVYTLLISNPRGTPQGIFQLKTSLLMMGVDTARESQTEKIHNCGRMNLHGCFCQAENSIGVLLSSGFRSRVNDAVMCSVEYLTMRVWASGFRSHQCRGFCGQ